MRRYQYPIRRDGRMPRGEGRGKQGIWILISLVLVIALAVTLFVTMPHMNASQGSHDYYVARMRTECEAAVSTVKYLSRTNSSNSYAQLATIRSSVYAADVLNQTSHAVEDGDYPVDTAIFTQVYATIDAYYNALTTGKSTTDALTTLTQQLDTLHAYAFAAK